MRISCKCGGARSAVDGEKLPVQLRIALGAGDVQLHSYYECNKCGEIAVQRKRGQAVYDTTKLRATTIEICETLLANLEEFSQVLRNALEAIKETKGE